MSKCAEIPEVLRKPYLRKQQEGASLTRHLRGCNFCAPSPDHKIRSHKLTKDSEESANPMWKDNL
eukprot:5684437-Amphidinium_carterae.1